MWASCCGWLCLDDSSIEEPRSSQQHQAFTNSGFTNSSPTAPEPTCKACGGRFESLTRKQVCMDCRKSFCGRCSIDPDTQPWLCRVCLRFRGVLRERGELMKLKVKDLREYLHLHGVPTQTCREKEELVDLVLGQQTHTSSGVHTPAQEPHGDRRSTDDTEDLPGNNNNMMGLATDGDGQISAEAPAESELDVELQIQMEDQISDTEEVLAPGRRASLSDLRSAEDIEALSVRQLKEILARNFVDYKGCCEKWELMERVTRLYHDQQDLHQMVSNPADSTDIISGTAAVEENLCKICMDSPIDCVLLECGHMVTCTKCGKRMSECPICRQYVVRAVHVFRS
ncbi:hypothetical protein DNTS_006354 [Danionella cerebrum]|uniref:RING-type E3 ubiquitin transferase n=1 Tax=Danionella cerebrum TaxID=2873325 RepID=A0A553Q5G5_9TELE|nr:hypothetical protein DNTS_006354 [Danionella translucida]